MSVLKDSVAGLKPVIYVAWIVAIIRLIVESRTTDLNVVAMVSVYAAIFVMFVFCGFTGLLDKLVWKRLLVGSLVLGIGCFFVPNTIAYTVAQFQGWEHGRFHVDQEHWAVQKRLMDVENLGFFESASKAEEEIGRKATTRGPPIEESTGGKIKAGLTVGFFTTIAGTLWSLVLGVLLIGIPATVRNKRVG